MIDYAIWPVLVGSSVLLSRAVLALGLPPAIATPICVSIFTLVVVALERVRPEREDHRALDRPILLEAAHWLFGLELGFGIALVACAGVGRVVARFVTLPRWPESWPLAAQIVLALLLYEGTSYWQHRAIHRFESLFRFHALHHSGERLNFARTARFHVVDFATASFIAYLPLTLLGASDRFYTTLGVLLAALGILQHANIRMRTPAWLDRIVCTPAVHRHHHSRRRSENDTNFGNTLMLFDLLFGTYGVPRKDGPRDVGLDHDPVPARGFFRQILAPIRCGGCPTCGPSARGR
jgi:sterol desaturase/sphingolipid hydroxylase (fatty acid hydroxylase superfamily)